MSRYAEHERCLYYRHGISCRNKRYANESLCRKHVIALLQEIERSSGWIMFYLQHRELLEAERGKQ